MVLERVCMNVYRGIYPTLPAATEKRRVYLTLVSSKLRLAPRLFLKLTDSLLILNFTQMKSLLLVRSAF